MKVVHPFDCKIIDSESNEYKQLYYKGFITSTGELTYHGTRFRNELLKYNTSKKSESQSWYEKPPCTDIIPSIIDYTALSWVVDLPGNTEFRDKLTKQGGFFSKTLTRHPNRGWVFPKSRVNFETFKKLFTCDTVGKTDPYKFHPRGKNRFILTGGDKVETEKLLLNAFIIPIYSKNAHNGKPGWTFQDYDHIERIKDALGIGYTEYQGD